MSESKDNSLGFLDMLCVLFIGLKLTGHIDWSWWWVLAPAWCPFVAILALGLLIHLLEKD